MKHYVFIPIVELEFWLLYSTAKQLKEIYPERKQTIIFLSHTRLDGKFKEEKKHFDEVIEFPWFQPSLIHGLKMLYLSYKFSQLLSRKFSKNTTFFCCGFKQFIHHHVLNYTTKKKWEYINIQLYPSEKKSPSQLINWRFTLINSLFFFLKFNYICLYYNYKDSKNISKIKYVYLFKSWKVQNQIIININHNYHPFSNVSYIDFFPNPYLFLKKQKSISCNLNSPSILILLAHNDITKDTPSFYKKVTHLIKFLHYKNAGVSIYIKFHPGLKENFEAIKTSYYTPLDKNISAESLYISYSSKLKAVLGSFSTALAVATDFAIPAYDCSKFLGINAPTIFKQYELKQYANKPIIYVNTKEDLSLIQPKLANKKNHHNLHLKFKKLLQQLDTI